MERRTDMVYTAGVICFFVKNAIAYWTVSLTGSLRQNIVYSSETG